MHTLVRVEESSEQGLASNHFVKITAAKGEVKPA